MHRYLAAALTLTASAFLSPVQAQDATRELHHVKGDVYRFQNNFHYALVVETEDGVVVGDPISAEAAGWLEAEIEQRFGKPVTFLIMSHSHGDHNSGGEVYADTAEVIAHANTAAAIEKDNLPTAKPTQTFEDTLTFETGGKTFELTYLGVGHGDDLIATVVRPENVAFVVDAVSTRRLPYRDLNGVDVDGLIEQIKIVESLDFEILAPGHSTLGTKQDATEARIYVEELRDKVQAGLDAGKSVDELVAEVDLSAYEDWFSYEQFRELNIQGMARWLQSQGG